MAPTIILTVHGGSGSPAGRTLPLLAKKSDGAILRGDLSHQGHVMIIEKPAPKPTDGDPTTGLLALEILNAIPHVVCATSTDLLQVQYLNPAAESVYGRPRSEFAGNPGLWREVIHPSDRPRFTEALRQLSVDGYYDLSYRIRRPNGSVRWLIDHTRIQYDDAGLAARIFSVRRDVTDRRRSEEAIERSGRLAAIGTLAAGIAHEINNPVGAALLATETALAIQDRADQRELLGLSLRSAVDSLNRCGKLIRNILRFARNEDSEKPLGDLNQNVRQARDFIHQYADDQGITIDACLDDSVPPILVNSLEIQQVIVNLLHNAIQASKPGQTVCVHTRCAGKVVMLIVQDNGRGMDEEQQQHVFDPFYTTRQGTGGTGLGMSITFGIVQDHHGAIRIQSELGRGTTLTIELPVPEQDSAD